jgi:hypothetical protein
MQDSTIIHCWVQVGVCLLGMLFCADILSGKRRATLALAGIPFRTSWIEARYRIIFLFSNQNPPSTLNSQPGAAPGRISTKNVPSTLSDWLAPIIVWILVILMVAAIVGFLLGQK